MSNPTCKVDQCASPAAKRGWCGKHYQRWWKHGDPTYEPTTYTTCQVADCPKPPRSRTSGLCEMHYVRRYRHGDPLTVIDTRKPTATYRVAHARLQVDRGPATDHPCVDCGEQAGHWSYNNADPDELVSDGGQPYTLNQDAYDPRCYECHAAFDGTGWNQFTGAKPR